MRTTDKDKPKDKESSQKKSPHNPPKLLDTQGYANLLTAKGELEILLQLLKEQTEVIRSIQSAHPFIHRQTGLNPNIERNHTEMEHPIIQQAAQRIAGYAVQMERLNEKCVSAIQLVNAPNALCVLSPVLTL
jgi:hypothetical protein